MPEVLADDGARHYVAGVSGSKWEGANPDPQARALPSAPRLLKVPSYADWSLF